MSALQFKTQSAAAGDRHPASVEAPVAPMIATAIVALTLVAIVAQTTDPIAYLVGMTPLAWIALEGAWRLLR